MTGNTNRSTRHKSALVYVLTALIPYTRPNLLLAFRPNQFFNELDRLSPYSETELRAAYSQAKHRKLVSYRGDDKPITLSLKARQAVAPFVATTLTNGGRLMVIFDIPEDFAAKRRRFRYLLRQLGFEHIQQSVWISDKDYRALLEETIDESGLHGWVQLYEAARIA